MDLAQIRYRSLLSLEFLSNSTDIPTNYLHHLQCISVLLSAGEYYKHHQALKKVQADIDNIRTLTYAHNNQQWTSVIHNEQGMTSWNAIMSIIMWKSSRTTEAISFLNSVILCIENNRVHPLCRAFASTDELNKQSTGELGLILLSILYAHQQTKNDEYLVHAKKVANQIHKRPTSFNASDTWGLTLLSEPYLNKRDKIIDEFKQIGLSAHTSLFAAMAQQSYVSKSLPDEELAKHQFTMQVDTNNNFDLPEKYRGAFVRKSVYPEVRLDYTVQNLQSFMQMLLVPDVDIQFVV